MNVSENVSLSGYSTMGLGGPAAYLAEITERSQVPEALGWAKERGLPALMIGGGSNIIWKDEGFSGLVLVNRLKGLDIKEVPGGAEIKIAAGENWDSVVERCVSEGLTGIEALSLVPGSAGGTPVQNVGAYGQEISETLVSLEAYDVKSGTFVELSGDECGFSYRDSRFKTGPDRGRFFITSLTLRLKKGDPEPPFYASVQKYFEEHGVRQYTAAGLREAVIAIRAAKLPDPAKVHNTGSFFANPIISRSEFSRLEARFKDIPHWEVSDRSIDTDGTVSAESQGGGDIKLSAAWLIEQAGFKDYHDEATGMATWPRQPLVLVNEKAGSAADLLAFKKKIVGAVQDKFGVTLIQEPELLP